MITVYDRANGEIVGEVPEMNKTEVDAAIDRTSKAFPSARLSSAHVVRGGEG